LQSEARSPQLQMIKGYSERRAAISHTQLALAISCSVHSMDVKQIHKLTLEYMHNHIIIRFTVIKCIYTSWREIKLPAGHNSISSIPGVITYSSPLEVTADLDSTFKIILPILESDITIRTRS